MARNMSAHTRYRLAATAFAVAGGFWCLGAMFGQHAMTLLVIGMMNLAASMLLMSLRPPKGAVGEEDSRGCENCSHGRQTAELKVRTLRMERPAGQADTKTEPTNDAGATRPRERKTKVWSI